MSGKKIEKNNTLTEKLVEIDESKRRLSKAGLVAPVILSLASKPVFAVQGLSNMMSTHGSAACRGDDYYGGFSQQFWSNQSGALDTDGSATKWRIATNTSGQNYETVTIASAFGGNHYPPNTTGNDTLLSVVRRNGSTESQIVSGYLNLSYYANSTGSGQYFLTAAQFWDLNNDSSSFDLTQIIGTTSDPIIAFGQLIENNMDGVPNTCI